MKITKNAEGWMNIELSPIEASLFLLEFDDFYKSGVEAKQEEDVPANNFPSIFNLASAYHYMFSEEAVDTKVEGTNTPLFMLKIIADEWNKKYPNSFTEQYINQFLQ